MSLETQIEVELRVIILDPRNGERTEIVGALTAENVLGRDWSEIVAHLVSTLAAKAMRGTEEVERQKVTAP